MTRHLSREEARERFFEAAVAVCAERGYAATRMEDIARAAGRSKGSLYHHFSSKGELFLELVHAFLEGVMVQLETRVAAADSVADAVRELTREAFDEMSDPALGRVFAEFTVLASRDPAIQSRFHAYYDAAVSKMASVFEAGVARGEFRADLDPEATARAFAMATDGLAVMHAGLGDDGDTVAKNLAIFVDAFLTGVCVLPA